MNQDILNGFVASWIGAHVLLVALVVTLSIFKKFGMSR